MKDRKRLPTTGEPIPWKSPFATLKSMDLPLAPEGKTSVTTGEVAPPSPKKSRGRVDIIRQTAHRGGKTVTVVTGFTGISLAEKEALAKDMQKACGAGGTVKEGRIEVQGDQRDIVSRILTNAGFRPVCAGG
ncbi:MAG: translation initiation factor [Nitrospirota bacterium]|nr:translation initiation factor [Nitrospirota bacterium]